MLSPSQPHQDGQRHAEDAASDLTRTVMELKLELAEARTELGASSHREQILAKEASELRLRLEIAAEERDEALDMLARTRGTVAELRRDARDSQRVCAELRVKVESLQAERDGNMRCRRCERLQEECASLREENERLEGALVDCMRGPHPSEDVATEGDSVVRRDSVGKESVGWLTEEQLLGNDPARADVKTSNRRGSLEQFISSANERLKEEGHVNIFTKRTYSKRATIGDNRRGSLESLWRSVRGAMHDSMRSSGTADSTDTYHDNVFEDVINTRSAAGRLPNVFNLAAEVLKPHGCGRVHQGHPVCCQGPRDPEAVENGNNNLDLTDLEMSDPRATVPTNEPCDPLKACGCTPVGDRRAPVLLEDWGSGSDEEEEGEGITTENQGDSEDTANQEFRAAELKGKFKRRGTMNDVEAFFSNFGMDGFEEDDNLLNNEDNFEVSLHMTCQGSCRQVENLLVAGGAPEFRNQGWEAIGNK